MYTFCIYVHIYIHVCFYTCITHTVGGLSCIYITQLKAMGCKPRTLSLQICIFLLVYTTHWLDNVPLSHVFKAVCCVIFSKQHFIAFHRVKFNHNQSLEHTNHHAHTIIRKSRSLLRLLSENCRRGVFKKIVGEESNKNLATLAK